MSGRLTGADPHTIPRAVRVFFGVLALAVLQNACAPQRSVGELPQLQETLTIECPPLAIRECHVWGGNKFRKRYEFCRCGDRGR